MRRVRRFLDGRSLCGRVTASAVKNKTKNKRNRRRRWSCWYNHSKSITPELWNLREKKHVHLKKLSFHIFSSTRKHYCLSPPKLPRLKSSPRKPLRGAEKTHFALPDLSDWHIEQRPVPLIPQSVLRNAFINNLFFALSTVILFFSTSCWLLFYLRMDNKHVLHQGNHVI